MNTQYELRLNDISTSIDEYKTVTLLLQYPFVFEKVTTI